MDLHATSFDEVSRDLGLPAAAQLWRPAWDRSASAPAPEFLEAISPASLRHACRWIGLADEPSAAIVAAAEAIAARPSLRRLLWHAHYCLFIDADPAASRCADWPMLPAALGPPARLFYAVMFLSGVPHVSAVHRRRGIDESVTRDTLADLAIWLEDYRGKNGQWGLDQNAWFHQHFTGRLLTLGRLQFAPGSSGWPFWVYRRRSDGRILTLAGDGLAMQKDGQYGLVGFPFTQYAANDYQIAGQPIDGRGRIEPNVVVLERGQWDLVLEKGDAVLAVHIPATGPMTPEACARSLRDAAAFFPRHFPEFDFRAFVCSSWLLDAQLADHLPAECNIVRFLKRFHLLPVRDATDFQTMERVFGGPPASLADAPRDTTLRRAVLAHMEAGGVWRQGAGFILWDEAG